MEFQDPVNPTSQEIEEWAYSDDPVPVQDGWDLCVGEVMDDRLAALVLKIASDPRCPKQRFFVRCLNVMTGGVVHFAADRGFDPAALAALERLSHAGVGSSSPPVVDWAWRARRVSDNPRRFRYRHWFGW